MESDRARIVTEATKPGQRIDLGHAKVRYADEGDQRAAAASTIEFLSRFGLYASDLPIYPVVAWGESFNLVRLTAEQLAHVPVAERPTTLSECKGQDFLMCLSVEGAAE